MSISVWKRLAPWLLSILSIIALILLSYFIIDNIKWFKTEYDYTKLTPIEYRNILLILTAVFKRSIGFFTGLLLIFIGSSISAYVMSKQTELKLNTGEIGLSIISVSPGIVAMVLGVIIMIIAITSKDEFSFTDSFQSPQTSQSSEAARGKTGDLNSKETQ